MMEVKCRAVCDIPACSSATEYWVELHYLKTSQGNLILAPTLPDEWRRVKADDGCSRLLCPEHKNDY